MTKKQEKRRDEIRALVNSFAGKPMSPAEVNMIKAQLKEAGLNIYDLGLTATTNINNSQKLYADQVQRESGENRENAVKQKETDSTVSLIRSFDGKPITEEKATYLKSKLNDIKDQVDAQTFAELSQILGMSEETQVMEDSLAPEVTEQTEQTSSRAVAALEDVLGQTFANVGLPLNRLDENGNEIPTTIPAINSEAIYNAISDYMNDKSNSVLPGSSIPPLTHNQVYDWIRDMQKTGKISKDDGAKYRDDRFDDTRFNVVESYSRVLDSIGMNNKNPLAAFSTRFNRLNHNIGLEPQIPGNSYIFFTRPDCNWSLDNLSSVPFFDWISKTEIGKIAMHNLEYPGKQSYADSGKKDSGVGGLLTGYRDITDAEIEKRGWLGFTGLDIANDWEYRNPSPFNMLMSNTCTKFAGAIRDLSMDVYTTKSNFFDITLEYAKGLEALHKSGDASTEFIDCQETPVFLMFFIWMMYIHYVSRGPLKPNIAYIRDKIIDYTISSYGFQLANDNNTILRWWRTSGMMPNSLDIANQFVHSKEIDPDKFRTISPTFRYQIPEFMNPLTFIDFNMLSLEYYNSSIASGTNSGSTNTAAILDNAKVYLESLKTGTGMNDMFPEAFLKVEKGDGINTYRQKMFYRYQNLLDEVTITNNEFMDDVRKRKMVWAQFPLVIGNKLYFL